MVKVTQEDREAAAAIFHVLQESDAPITELAKAFAAHREAATLKERERCAGVAEDHAARAWEIGELEGQNVTCSSGRNHGARDIATAIRNIKEG